MGFSYFKEYRNWQQVTRDERYFCLELYNLVKGKEQDFIRFLSATPSLSGLNFSSSEINAEWEIGFEVCFYRDYIKKIGYWHQGELNKNIRTIVHPMLERENDKTVVTAQSYKFPMKRTFDLCLFSEKRIIIIEAKSNTGYDTEQIKTFNEDEELLADLLGEHIKIDFIGLASSRYFQNLQTYNKLAPEFFKSKHLTWQDLAAYAAVAERDWKIFEQADAAYKDSYKVKF